MTPVNSDMASQRLPMMVEAAGVTVASRSLSQKVSNAFAGIAQSTIVKAVVFSAAATLLAGFLIGNPMGWIATAVVVASMAAIYLYAHKQKTSFEVVTLWRLFQRTNFHEVKFPGVQLPGKIYLGSLPNELGFAKMRGLIVEENGLAVLAVNEAWELTPRLVSHPLSKKHWASLGVAHEWIEAKDHYPLGVEAMDRAADWMCEQMAAGKNIYVHCRAGLGRSATAVAAFLMKYTDLPIETICAAIKKSRKQSSIWDKVGVLRQYDAQLVGRPPISKDIHFMADALDKQGAKPKIKHMDKQTKAKCQQIIAACAIPAAVLGAG